MMQTTSGLFHAATNSVDLYLHYSNWLEVIVFFLSSIRSGSYTLPVPDSAEFLEPRGEGFDAEILFRTESFKAFYSLL